MNFSFTMYTMHGKWLDGIGKQGIRAFDSTVLHTKERERERLEIIESQTQTYIMMKVLMVNGMRMDVYLSSFVSFSIRHRLAEMEIEMISLICCEI